MGAKSLYLDNREKYREQINLANDFNAISAVKNGFQRFKKYSSTWQVLNLDEIVNKLFKNPIYKNIGQKFTITDKDSNYIIYCDNGGSYFRIGDKRVPAKFEGHYLDINLSPLLNENINGRTVGVSRIKRMALTHFKMEIKKEDIQK